ncbi:MAG: class B sortase [Ruminococcus sp.]|nr:class B sortase [Ruminococcus sp.]
MNSGTIFAPLLNYESKGFAQEHPTIQLETEQGAKRYSFYAAVRVLRDDMFYNLKDAPNKEYYDQKVANITQRALYTVGKQPQFGQKLITLSTCTNTSYDDRIIVIAVQV